MGSSDAIFKEPHLVTIAEMLDRASTDDDADLSDLVLLITEGNPGARLVVQYTALVVCWDHPHGSTLEQECMAEEAVEFKALVVDYFKTHTLALPIK